MDIVMAIGKQDPFLDNNLHMSQVLRDKGVDHQLHLWEDRAHSGHYWRQMVRIYL